MGQCNPRNLTVSDGSFVSRSVVVDDGTLTHSMTGIVSIYKVNNVNNNDKISHLMSKPDLQAATMIRLTQVSSGTQFA